jgi:hypothetical protein
MLRLRDLIEAGAMLRGIKQRAKALTASGSPCARMDHVNADDDPDDWMAVHRRPRA